MKWNNYEFHILGFAAMLCLNPSGLPYRLVVVRKNTGTILIDLGKKA